MTPSATIIGAAVAGSLFLAWLIFHMIMRRADRSGAWQPVQPIWRHPALSDGSRSGGSPVMRRWTGSSWEYRRMTSDELSDFLGRSAW